MYNMWLIQTCMYDWLIKQIVLNGNPNIESLKYTTI